MEDNAGAAIHTVACGGPHAAAGGYALKEAAPHGEPTQDQAPRRSYGPGAGFLAGSVACGGPTLELSIPEGLHPMERTCAGTVLEEQQSMRRTYFGRQRQSVTNTRPIPHPPAPLRLEEEVEESAMKR